MPKYDIEAIWKRLRGKIDLSKVKGATPKQWRKDFIKNVRESGAQTKALDKIGRKGFFSKINKPNFFPKQGTFISRVDGRTAVLDRRGKTHLVKSENVRVKEGFYMGKRAVYISNKRTGHRITMSLIGSTNTESTLG